MQGLRVLDHGHVWAGPLLAGSFADMGAEVIKVGSPAGQSGVSMGGQGMSGTVTGGRDPDAEPARWYHGWDRGKKSINLDLSVPEGRSLYLRLVAISDIVIENFSARVMPGLGLGYETLRAANPAIIMASLSATGATPGPWRDLVTYGPSLAALYGVKSLLGYHDDPHPREDPADLDPTAAAHGFVAICAALEYRERTGRGQHIDMAQGEATMQRIAEPLMDYFMNGRVAGTQGNRQPGFAPHGIYRAAGDDAWISIVVRDDEEWAGLLRVCGDDAPALADQRFATLPGRLTAQDELDAAIETWTSRYEAMDLTQRLQAQRVAAFPAMGPPELIRDANYEAVRRAGVRMAPGSETGLDLLYQGIPWKLSRTPGIIQGPTPERGEDSDYVYGELLGLDGKEIAALRERSVI
jgi:crotonobetainyl-CoA:carnitine CoA-transferase CaiB-like acyl-CoA transferase